MNDKLDFGSFIAEHRRKHSIASQDFAKKIGISNAYLSQIEHGKKTNISKNVLNKIIISLKLDKAETEILYDLFADANGCISPDIADYVSGSKPVQEALRIARDSSATAEEWKSLVNLLKK